MNELLITTASDLDQIHNVQLMTPQGYSIIKNDKVVKLAENISNRIKYNTQTKELLLFAVKNLIKKNDFLQLYIQVIEGQITDEEYDNELENNSVKYVVEPRSLQSVEELKMISEIIKQLSMNFNVDEVADIFGIKLNSIIEESGYQKSSN